MRLIPETLLDLARRGFHHAGARLLAMARQRNPWWDDLRKRSNGAIFVKPDAAAFDECRRISDAYDGILKRYGIAREQFFAGSIKNEDAAALHALVRARRPELAYQVGTFAGYSAMVIASALRAAGGGELIACDPEVPHRTAINPVDLAREAAAALGLSDHLRFVRGWHAVTMGEDFSDQFKKTIPVTGQETLRSLDRPIDFAFIDGDHSATATVCDLMVIQQFLSVGGVVVFHDVLSWPSVAKAVQMFVDDIYFLRSGTGRYFALDTWPGPDGLAALQRTAAARHPLLRIRVLDAKDGRSVGRAQVRIPSTGFDIRAGNDGAVYHFGEVTPDAAVEVLAPGYRRYAGNIEVGTNGDFAEAVVWIDPET